MEHDETGLWQLLDTNSKKNRQNPTRAVDDIAIVLRAILTPWIPLPSKITNLAVLEGRIWIFGKLSSAKVKLKFLAKKYNYRNYLCEVQASRAK